MSKVLNNWKKGEEGATLIFVGVSLSVLLGFAALTFDLGRMAAAQSDMQTFADHVALAAAGELDGKNDAITRARAAANQLIQDRQTFATGPQTLGSGDVFQINFMEELPADDNAALTYLDETNASSAARASYVEVATSQRSVFLPFYNAYAALRGEPRRDGLARARAVAGSQEWACDVPTLMFCLPQDVTLFEGQGMLLRSAGGNSAWGPGNFGFVDTTDFVVDPNGPCSTVNGVDLYQCLVAASSNRTSCIPSDGVTPRPGQGNGVTNAVFNTRFDMFEGSMTNEKTNSAYAPGPHVVKGLTSNGNGQCMNGKVTPSPDTMAFPPDDCFGPGTPCPYGDGRFGDGKWNNGRADYVSMNYGTTLDPHAFDHDDSTKKVETRFQYYMSEVSKAKGGAILQGRSETGLPQCSPPNARSDDPYRRVFVAAGVDCGGVDMNGKNKVPVEKYYEVFLLQPVGGGNGNSEGFDLFVEVIGEAGGDGAGQSSELSIFRNVVELYR